MSAPVLPFPWQQLPVVRKPDLELQQAAKRAFESRVDLSELPRIASQLFLAEWCDAGVQRARVTSERRHLGCEFVVRGDGLVIFLSLEPTLVALLVRRVLGQPPRVDTGHTLGPATMGASLAILTEVARRVSRGAPLTPDLTPLRDERSVALAVAPQPAWSVDFWVRLDNTSYSGFAAISADGSAVGQRATAIDVSRALPIRLPLIIARCVLDSGDYHSLSVGDVVVPNESDGSSWAPAKRSGTSLPEGSVAWLCSPGATRALALRSHQGKLCLAGVTDLSYDVGVTSKQPANPEAPDAQPAPAADVALDAPVVLHLELGAVTLPAQAWLSLRVGDVVCSDLPVGQPVTLRTAERAVAEGELVTVDGQVGVRIQRFFDA